MGKNKICVIMHACPGAGKSFLAKSLAEKYGCEICSTDSYFVNPLTGNYEFNFQKLGYNHKRNLEKAEYLMENGESVIIDNTNLQMRDVRPYVEIANDTGHQIIFAVPNNEWSNNPEECYKRCTHNVPLDRIQAMCKNMRKPEELVNFFKNEGVESKTLSEFENEYRNFVENPEQVSGV